MSDKKTIFISYSHLDEDPWKEYVVRHLKVAEKQGRLKTWDDRRIEGGSGWRAEIRTALEECDVAILLVSFNSLTSDFILDDEVTEMLRLRASKGLTIYPILIRDCNWQAADWLREMNLRPKDGKPLWSFEDSARDTEMARICQEIEQILDAKNGGGGGIQNSTLPKFNVPHRRNPNFTGREEILDQLSERLQSGEPAALVQAIAGLGGVGKTQIAAEYAYRHQDTYEVVWWVRSEEPTTLAKDYADLAKAIDHPAKNLEDQKVVVDAVRRWLNEHDGWLLVFDNAEDRKSIKPYLPPNGRGHVIITSRNQLWDGLAKHLPIDNMEPDEAVDLLINDRSVDAEKAHELAKELGRLPLALAQAKAYMDETRASVSSYLDLFKEHQAELLKLGELIDYDSSVATTWEISFEAATKQKPAAADLMNVCAFLAAGAIPETLFLVDDEEVPDALADLCRNELDFRNSIAALRRYSLIEAEKDTLSFHRLVQAVARDRLSKPEQDYWWTTAISLTNNALPNDGDDARRWLAYQRLLPHALSVTKDERSEELHPEAVGRMLDHIGNYSRARANFADAEHHLNRARGIREKTFGKDHADVAETLNNLGWLLSDQGRYRDAEQMIKSALEIRETTLGSEHPDTVMSLNNLALLYHSQGRYPKAEPLFLRALEIRKKTLGDEHPDTARSLNNLAGLYEALGHYQEAEPLFLRALGIRKKKLGDEHPDTATSFNNLAVLYDAQGHFQKAEQFYLRALTIWEKALGDKHPSTASSFRNIGVFYLNRQRKEDAEVYFQSAFKIYEGLVKADPENLVFQEQCEFTRKGLQRVKHREPVRREQKVGRNDRCPCGSGKKFKHCHGKAAA